MLKLKILKLSAWKCLQGKEQRLNDTPKALLNRDFKDFEMGEKEIGIGQLDFIAEDMVLRNLKAKLIEEMDKARKKKEEMTLFWSSLTFSRKVPD